MTIWEKTVLNMQKGAHKISATAAVFSERIKAEIAIARLRIRMNEVQALIDEQHRDIGRLIVDLAQRNELPKTTEQLLAIDDIASAMNELEERVKELGELNAEVKNEQDAFKPVTKQAEDTAV
jgi:hypothetical protein